MVTPEERITRLEAIQEANSQQLAEVLSVLGRILITVEAARQEAREMNEIARREAREDNEAARREAREMNEATRREAREMNEATRKEAREDNEATRKEAREYNEVVRRETRILFLSLLTLGVALFGTVLGTSLAG